MTREPARRAPHARHAANSSARVSYSVARHSELAELHAAWDDLFRHAIEANPFFAPWMLEPALRRMARKPVRLLCIWDGDDVLIGLLPVAAGAGHSRLPVPYIETWLHELCFYGAPLVRRGAEAAFVQGLFAFADKEAPWGGYLRLPLLDFAGPVARMIQGRPGGRLVYAAGLRERAALRGGFDAEALVRKNLPGKKGQEMRRRRNRLSEIGPLSLRLLGAGDGDDLDEWMQTFLALEDMGWKGQAGTSLARNQAHKEFFLELLRGARQAGALQFLRLDVGDRPAAMMVNLVSLGEGYGFKMCYDEALARYSPGVLLEIELLGVLEAMTENEFMDSCAASDNQMINGLWPDRRRLATINIAPSNALSVASLSLCKILEDLSGRMREA